MTLAYIILWILCGAVAFTLTYVFSDNDEWKIKVDRDKGFKRVSFIMHLILGPFSLASGILHTMI